VGSGDGGGAGTTPPIAGPELHFGEGIHEGTRLLAVTGARGVCRSELWAKDWMWVFPAAKDDEMQHGH
jgi:hypothetical protein